MVDRRKGDETGSLGLDGLLFQAVRVTIMDHVLTVILNRPQRKNAINETLANELLYALDAAKHDPDVRVVVIGAAGDVFCAGADLAELSGVREPVTSTVPKRGELHDLSLRLRHLYKPVICKVQGPALAGALLIIGNATHVIASETARFSAPEIKRGLWPFMVMAALARVAPPRQALDFMLRGYQIDARQAVSWGLINQVVPATELSAAADALARELASLSPAAIRLGLEAWARQEELAFDEAIIYLKDMFAHCLATEDAREGIAAFMQKRQPIWKGR